MGATAESIAGDLTLAIHRGSIRPGEQVPPQSHLMKSYGVAMATAASALAKLSVAGLTRAEPGKGTFVREHPERHLCPVLDVLDAAVICRSLAATTWPADGTPTFTIGGHPDYDTAFYDPEKHWPPRKVGASALAALDRYVLRWMSEAFYAAARRMVAHGAATADPHLIAAAQAIVGAGAKRPENQPAIAVQGPPVPDDEDVVFRIWPERANYKPGPDNPPF